MTPHDDDLESLLRQALRAETEQVHPVGDGLAKIRERVVRPRPRFAWVRPAALAVGAAAVVSVGGVTLVSQSHQGGGGRLAGPAATSTASDAPTHTRVRTAPAPPPARQTRPRTTPVAPPVATATTERAGTAPPPADVAVTVPVYWLGDSGQGSQGPRLFREFARTTAAVGDEVAAALRLAVSRSPADSDYSSPWPAGTQVRSVTVAGDTATVDLSREAASTARDDLPVQQLVWTATAADPTVTRVRLEVAGAPVGSARARAAQVDVVAPVWILTPVEGARLSTRVALSGTASVFEGTVGWEVRQGTSVVDHGFAQASRGAPGRGTWTAKVPLQPGRYEVRAFESSPEDGSQEFVDTKTITVR